MHQYVSRPDGRIRTEQLYADRLVRWLYHPLRENATWLFRALTSPRASRLLAAVNYDLPFAGRLSGQQRFLQKLGVDLRECLDPPQALNTPRQVFERRIRYWDCRPMPADPAAVVSPADARILVGSLTEASDFFLKDKFFRFDELLGCNRPRWREAFAGGDFAIFRLTPDKYHYSHTPVAGRVVDLYGVDGRHHACNPTATVAEATPLSKNRRVVTIIDTDVPEGTGVGLVAMVEVVALMIGDVVQCYSAQRYDAPVAELEGLMLAKGCPKSRYRPGSSTDVLLFQPGRIDFDADLRANRQRRDVHSRFSAGFGQPLTETEVQLRTQIARRRQAPVKE